MLVEWNDTAFTFPDQGSLLDRLTAIAGQRGAAVAVACGDQRLTYARLVAHAYRLARHLWAVGVRPGARVGVCLRRSPEKAVAHLATFAAGACVVLLDPGQPAERLTYMISNAGIAAVLTYERFLALLPDDGVHLVCLDRDLDADDVTVHQTDPLPRHGDHAAAVAYVAYTSSSTGEPKAILLPWRAIDHSIDAMRHVLGLTGAERLAWLSGPGYGIFIAEVLPYLASGAEVHVVDEAAAQKPETLRDWLVAMSITDAVIVAPLAEHLLALPWPVGTPLRRMVVFGDRLRRWPPADLPFEVVTLYGSGEATCVACTHDAHRGLRAGPATASPRERETGVPPVGRPLPNVRTYVLDEHREPVPPQVVGELFVAGQGLALGYLDRPELTRDAFLPAPFDEERGSVLYRTGDLARYRPDGVIEVLGRADQQVAVRGFRVELGEVEAVLVRQPGVRQGVVVAREDVPGARRLVAYVVPEAPAMPTVGELRKALRHSLPDYMVPAAFVLLDAMPVNAHGKIDCPALPAPSGERPALGMPFEAPRGEVERRLAAVWSEVLDVRPVGVHDSFFDLGGDSLTAIQAVTRIRQDFGLDLPLPGFFDAPTIADTAATLVAELVRRAANRDDPAAAAT